MRRTAFPVVANLVAGFFLAGVVGASAQDEEAGGWRPLFNGRDLDGWTTNVTNQWVVADGVLTWKASAVDLWTVEPFGDFVLDLEYKASVRCNSGVFIRTADPKNNVQTGLEIQIWDSFGVAKLEKHHNAALYDAQAASRNAERKPGEWNRLTVTARGPRVVVELNGEVVNEIDLDRWTTPGQNPDGTANKFSKALKDFPRRGHIGLQDHHKAVSFRNIRIRELE